MYEYLGNNSSVYKKQINNASVESLGVQWAKKYLQNLDADSVAFGYSKPAECQNLKVVTSPDRREITAQKLKSSMRNVSLQAWNKTEKLLSKQLKRHRIKTELIDPWEITRDSCKIYEKSLDVYMRAAPGEPSMVSELASKEESRASPEDPIYAQRLAPNQLTKAISSSLGDLRQKYTQKDPRVIGFVSMQFHYTGQMLLHLLSGIEQSILSTYFKVVDDHLYMPLQRAYMAAAKLDSDSVALSAVRNLLPISTHIAKRITRKVIELYPAYRSYSGKLNNHKVIISSLWDVEMFQVYLWVCVLEGNIAAIAHELFPLCVMLYPTLKISWEIISQMLHLLGQEISERLNTEQANTLMPYFQVLWHMFSPEVFGENICKIELNTYDEIKTCKPLFA
ncbi:hypothetical protein Riv7116_6890 [Rivularia sp. PCC 7116]|uniref:hypothetical protein n=1 Tax=Rivularia sp. PCC 7116 TaxID=373994 RepID=UPI00029F3F6A|nr:hypothetical protein [Rivularia sp. PCC 7116]AFY59203.1 hypothetical protein Riv7116_6890 [Rivularia sp. PCC 7116]